MILQLSFFTMTALKGGRLLLRRSHRRDQGIGVCLTKGSPSEDSSSLGPGRGAAVAVAALGACSLVPARGRAISSSAIPSALSGVGPSASRIPRCACFCSRGGLAGRLDRRAAVAFVLLPDFGSFLFYFDGAHASVFLNLSPALVPASPARLISYLTTPLFTQVFGGSLFSSLSPPLFAADGDVY